MSDIINDLIYCKKTLDVYISERSSKKKKNVQVLCKKHL